MPIDAAPAVDRQRVFVLRVLRALKGVGAFYIVGHTLSSTLFQSCQQCLGGMPYKDDSVDGTDATYKVNYTLMSTLSPKPDDVLVAKMYATLGIPRTDFEALAKEHLDSVEDVSNGLLHAMAAAHTLADPDAAATITAYRGTWRDGEQSLGLRVPAYHPGPKLNAAGATLRTTARHTDSTWLTLLANDDVGGLHIHTTAGDVAVLPPVAGALLVNTGNLMKVATDGFFDAVCHWVDRTDETDSKTRISMPFFYDRKGGQTGGC